MLRQVEIFLSEADALCGRGGQSPRMSARRRSRSRTSTPSRARPRECAILSGRAERMLTAEEVLVHLQAVLLGDQHCCSVRSASVLKTNSTPTRRCVAAWGDGEPGISRGASAKVGEAPPTRNTRRPAQAQQRDAKAQNAARCGEPKGDPRKPQNASSSAPRRYSCARARAEEDSAGAACVPPSSRKLHFFGGPAEQMGPDGQPGGRRT